MLGVFARDCCIGHAGSDDELAREDHVFVIAQKISEEQSLWYTPNQGRSTASFVEKDNGRVEGIFERSAELQNILRDRYLYVGAVPAASVSQILWTVQLRKVARTHQRRTCMSRRNGR